MAILKEFGKTTALSSTSIVSIVPSALQKALAASATEDFSITAVTGTFIPGAGVLTFFGDNARQHDHRQPQRRRDDPRQWRRRADPRRHADRRQHQPDPGLRPGRQRHLTLNEANGALPRANLFGGAGNDVITGGSGDDHALRPGAATTRCSARAAPISCSAAPATTCSPAATATIRSSAKPATTA